MLPQASVPNFAVGVLLAQPGNWCFILNASISSFKTGVVFRTVTDTSTCQHYMQFRLACTIVRRQNGAEDKSIRGGLASAGRAALLATYTAAIYVRQIYTHKRLLPLPCCTLGGGAPPTAPFVRSI